MQKFRSLILASATAALALVFAGCGGSSSTNTQPPVTPTVSIVPDKAAVGGGQTVQFTYATSGSPLTIAWQVNGITGGNNAVGTISSSGLYTAPNGGTGQNVTVSVADTSNLSVTATAQVSVGSAGAVSPTANGQVASYTISLPSAGTVSVEFGTSAASYGRSTWQVASPAAGGTTTLLVAGMIPYTAYHMRADVELANGLSFQDSDHTFTTTQSVPSANLPGIRLTAPAGFTPQPGVELLTDINHGVEVYDLQGNLLWAYDAPDITMTDQVQPAEMLPNGNMLLQVSAGSPAPLDPPIIVPGTVYELREVDLANNLIQTLTLSQLNASLKAFGYINNQGVTPVLQDIHHELTINPVTGHLLVMANTVETISGLTGYTTPQQVLGDIVLDVDPGTFAIDWVWNEFDHLDVNRHPYEFPDWTHSNAIVYSPTDHNILVSMRHQNWVIKVDYNDGLATSGDILWHLGYQGDFTLMNNGAVDTDPQDWQYAQHEPAFTTANSAGVFGLTLMDNGTDRIFSPGYPCGTTGYLPCFYSRTPIFTIDDTNMTATLSNTAMTPAYSFFGGNAEVLANGNEHADLCAASGGALITETTVGDNPQLVWALQTVNTYMYRGHRIPSLYPGVQW